MKGYKTYAVVLVAVGYAVFGFLSGHIDANTSVELVLASFAVAGLRSGITSEVAKLQ